MPGKRPTTFTPNLIALLLTNDFVTAGMIASANKRDPALPYHFKAPLHRARRDLEGRGIVLLNAVKKGWHVSAADKEKLKAHCTADVDSEGDH